MPFGAWLPLAVFLGGYALFVVFPARRALTACAAAGLLVAAGAAPPGAVFTQHVPWNVLGLLAGMLVLAELFMFSRMPAVIAEALVDRSPTAWHALVLVALVSSLFSTFLDNVTVVLLLAPVALSLAARLKISPVRPLICIAVCSNLQGTATLIGDPPSMILASHLQMNFNEFFLYRGRPGIFWAVEAGALAAMFVVGFVLRRHREPAALLPVERARSAFPALLVGTLVLVLATGSFVDPGFRWFAGTAALLFAAGGVFWYLRVAKWGSVRELARGLDGGTLLFLLGMFVMVGALSDAGWLDRLAALIAARVGRDLRVAYVAIVLIAVLVSAFVDNVPFLVAMIPVTQKVADGLGAPVPLLMFGLLVGACLGGNITPIGASANVVTVGLLRREGHAVGFREFMRVGLPFTAAAVGAASLFVWFVWAP